MLAAVSNKDTAVVTINAAGIIQMANKAAEKLFGELPSHPAISKLRASATASSAVPASALRTLHLCGLPAAAAAICLRIQCLYGYAGTL